MRLQLEVVAVVLALLEHQVEVLLLQLGEQQQLGVVYSLQVHGVGAIGALGLA